MVSHPYKRTLIRDGKTADYVGELGSAEDSVSNLT